MLDYIPFILRAKEVITCNIYLIVLVIFFKGKYGDTLPCVSYNLTVH